MNKLGNTPLSPSANGSHSQKKERKQWTNTKRSYSDLSSSKQKQNGDDRSFLQKATSPSKPILLRSISHISEIQEGTQSDGMTSPQTKGGEMMPMFSPDTAKYPNLKREAVTSIRR